MQNALLLCLLTAFTGINAAPSLASRQLDAIAIGVYDSDGCNNGPPSNTANVPTDGSCFPISAILTENTSSGLVDTALPAGCTGE